MNTTDATFTARHAIGARVALEVTVTGVNFTEGKVRYNIDFGGYPLVVDSCDVHPLPVEVAA